MWREFSIKVEKVSKYVQPKKVTSTIDKKSSSISDKSKEKMIKSSKSSQSKNWNDTKMFDARNDFWKYSIMKYYEEEYRQVGLVTNLFRYFNNFKETLEFWKF